MCRSGCVSLVVYTLLEGADQLVNGWFISLELLDPPCLSGWVVRPGFRRQVLPPLSGMCINSLKGPGHRASLCGYILGAKDSVFLHGVLCLPWSPLTFIYSFQKYFLPPPACIWDTDMHAIGSARPSVNREERHTYRKL